MKVLSNQFIEQSSRALDNAELQQALGKATARFRESRIIAFDGFPAGESLRDRARAIKAETLGRIDTYLDTLATAVERAGGAVHWAADAREARDLVIRIAKDHRARLAVKSKSMTTEEIGLNEALEQAGVETIETDLGEYIIQLAGESPSHIIAPAIHKTKTEVCSLFAQKLGEPDLENELPAGHHELTDIARRHLRQRFREADIGITGVNFAVAESGTLAIVENEGNARLVTTLPRVHIAIMGLEKVIPNLADLAVFLRILARSATGQKASSYVSLITGPRDRAESDGPDHLHLIVLDNGRSRLLADPQLWESLMCIRCGACLNVCPVYRFAGGHSYGWVYGGPIGSVITPSLVGHERASHLPFASSLCGACRDACPVRIDLPRMLLAQRERVVGKKDPRRWLERRAVQAFVTAVSTTTNYARYTWVLRTVSRALPRRLARVMPGIARWTRSRDLPRFARTPFRDRWR